MHNYLCQLQLCALFETGIVVGISLMRRTELAEYVKL